MQNPAGPSWSARITLKSRISPIASFLKPFRINTLVKNGQREASICCEEPSLKSHGRRGGMLNRHATKFFIIMVLALSGCVGLNNLTDIADVIDSLPTNGALSCKDEVPRTAISSKLSKASVDRATIAATLPPKIAEHSVMEKLLQSFETQVAMHQEEDVPRGAGVTEPIVKSSFPHRRPDLEINSNDLKDFFKAFSETMLQPSTYTGTGRSIKAYDKELAPRTPANTNNPDNLDPQRTNVAHVFKVYYLEYINGKYVDRTGTNFAKPEIKKSIGNDVISAALMIFLDALADTQLRTPIFKSDAKYYPSGLSVRPTASAKLIVKTINVSTDPKACGITEPEAKAMAYLANLAGDKSMLLSGLILQSFAHLHASFVIGGNFAVGDNETFATLVKTFFESAGRRGVERGAYEFFWAYSYDDSQPRAAGVPGAKQFTYYDPNPAVLEARAAGGSREYHKVASFLEEFQ